VINYLSVVDVGLCLDLEQVFEYGLFLLLFLAQPLFLQALLLQFFLLDALFLDSVLLIQLLLDTGFLFLFFFLNFLRTLNYHIGSLWCSSSAYLAHSLSISVLECANFAGIRDNLDFSCCLRFLFLLLLLQLHDRIDSSHHTFILDFDESFLAQLQREAHRY
jgi:hypothetical protein